jgi:hypothetical protein
MKRADATRSEGATSGVDVARLKKNTGKTQR